MEPIVTREREGQFDAYDQSLIEHFLIASSMPFKGRANMNFSDFTAHIEQGGEIDSDMFKPLRLIEEPQKIDEVARRREAQGSFGGIMVFIDRDYQLSLLEDNKQIGFELAPLLPSGETRRSWKLFLQDQSTMEKDYDAEELKRVKLSEKARECFGIQNLEEGNEVRLVFTK